MKRLALTNPYRSPQGLSSGEGTRLDFTLQVGSDQVPGHVEVRVWPWLALRGFRMTIADRVVYTEGTLRSSGNTPSVS